MNKVLFITTKVTENEEIRFGNFCYCDRISRQ